MKTIKRRRKEGRTDYLNRLKLLKSGSPRVVFRKSNRYVTAQYLTSKQAQDKVEFEINSKDLMKYGWPKEQEGSLKGIPASYLSGFLMGKKITKNKMEKPIIDLGMLRTIHGTKVYAFIKGLIDSGIKISCKEEAFPTKDRITGKHMKEDFSETFNKIKSKIEVE